VRPCTQTLQQHAMLCGSKCQPLSALTHVGRGMLNACDMPDMPLSSAGDEQLRQVTSGSPAKRICTHRQHGGAPFGMPCHKGRPKQYVRRTTGLGPGTSEHLRPALHITNKLSSPRLWRRSKVPLSA